MALNYWSGQIFCSPSPGCRRWVAVAVILLSAMPVSAGRTISTPNSSSANDPKPQTPAALPAASAVGSSPVKSDGKTAALSIPKDARWTLECQTIKGDGHVLRARQLKEQLVATINSNQWYVVHSDEMSVIYYGFYSTIDRSTPGGQTARADLDRVKSIKAATGDPVFTMPYFTQIDRPAPDAPEQWNMSNHFRSRKEFWSLQIAAYTADATDDQGHDRKWAAVEYVKQLRADGVDAFFCHDDGMSTVCVGIWPEDAVKSQGGNAKGNVADRDPNAVLGVTNIPAVPNIPANPVTGTPEIKVDMHPKTADGQKIKMFTPKLEILDPTLQKMIDKYPEHTVNGSRKMHEVIEVQTRQRKIVGDPSVLVMISEKKKTSDSMTTNIPTIDNGGLNALSPALIGLDQPEQPQPGLGKLKKAGGK